MPKFNARDYLKAPPEIETNLDLPNQLRADPTRLRQEFVAIATDLKESFNIRSRALMVLFRHPKELNALRSSEVTSALMTAFRREFPPDKLKSIGETMCGEVCTHEGFIAHLYCVLFATLSPDDARESINAIRAALKDTSLDAVLTKHLNRIGCEGGVS
jgi:hypothetical protein